MIKKFTSGNPIDTQAVVENLTLCLLRNFRSAASLKTEILS